MVSVTKFSGAFYLNARDFSDKYRMAKAQVGRIFKHSNGKKGLAYKNR
jgi:hypothetical protein